ncbi:MAG: hypothetical protein D6767_06680 [Candidatus Hydrogenedentota bacterium]|nr:MAG: hypothetical protein D6767_06680 [Candidatus Hydrogenedentota bacterium]
MPKGTVPQKKTSPVVLIFTIGVVGWGFYAINRLTAPLSSPSVQVTQNIPQPKPEKEKSVKQWLLDWIQEDAKTEGQRTAASPTQKSSFQEISLYFYKMNQKGETNLVPVPRKVSLLTESEPLKKIFEAVIQGPTDEEKSKDYLDAFPDKPRLRHVNRQGDTIVLDFEDEFGKGASFELIRLQLRQLLATAKALPGVNKIKIYVQGIAPTHVGGDGFPLPSVISGNI